MEKEGVGLKESWRKVQTDSTLQYQALRLLTKNWPVLSKIIPFIVYKSPLT